MSELLSLCDRHPKKVDIRNRESRPFLANEIWMTSSMPPEELFKNLSGGDSILQMYRRFEVYYLRDKRTRPIRWHLGDVQEDYNIIGHGRDIGGEGDWYETTAVFSSQLRRNPSAAFVIRDPSRSLFEKAANYP